MVAEMADAQPSFARRRLVIVVATMLIGMAVFVALGQSMALFGQTEDVASTKLTSEVRTRPPLRSPMVVLMLTNSTNSLPLVPHLTLTLTV